MKNFLKLSIVVFTFLTFTYNVQASSLNVSLDKGEVKTGNISHVSVILDTKGSQINTVEGDLVYDTNLLKIEQINTGDSFISFWIEKPTMNNNGTIHFAGLVPGGLSIQEGNVFSVLFRGLNEGEGNISLSNIGLFLNDGQGSKDEASLQNATVKVVKNTEGTFDKLDNQDKVSPEKFSITRTHDPSIFENKWFVVFDTQDKGTGIDHYRVCEFYKMQCVDGASPFVLKYQNPFYYITVYAYDLNNNVQKVSLVSNWLILIIIILISSLLYVGFRLYRRYLRKYKV